jgi:plastocyanin
MRTHHLRLCRFTIVGSLALLAVGCGDNTVTQVPPTADLSGVVTSGADLSGVTTSAGDMATTTAPMTVTVMVGPNNTFTFSPAAVTIGVGGTVTWMWAGSGHSVTGGNNATCTADNSFCSPNDTNCSAGATSPAGATYSHTFATAGTFQYFCTPHCMSGMKGSVTVQ